MNPYGYLRVSGKGQIDGDGPERQKDSILKFCLNHGIGQPTFFFDAAVSGTVEAMDRPEFVRMLDAIERMRKVAGPDAPVCIIIERLDRLARDLIVQELLLAECAAAKIQVYAADQSGCADLADAGIDPTRKMLRQILGVVAEWEKSVLVLKLRAARVRKRIKYGHCEGPKPYGETPHEKTVRSVILTLHHSGRSYGEIAKELNRMAYHPRAKPNKPRKPWTRSGVYQVINQRGVKNPKPITLETQETPPV